MKDLPSLRELFSFRTLDETMSARLEDFFCFQAWDNRFITTPCLSFLNSALSVAHAHNDEQLPLVQSCRLSDFWVGYDVGEWDGGGGRGGGVKNLRHLLIL